jgi:hypothetical protein
MTAVYINGLMTVVYINSSTGSTFVPVSSTERHTNLSIVILASNSRYDGISAVSVNDIVEHVSRIRMSTISISGTVSSDAALASLVAIIAPLSCITLLTLTNLEFGAELDSSVVLHTQSAIRAVRIGYYDPFLCRVDPCFYQFVTHACLVVRHIRQTSIDQFAAMFPSLTFLRLAGSLASDVDFIQLAINKLPRLTCLDIVASHEFIPNRDSIVLHHPNIVHFYPIASLNRRASRMPRLSDNDRRPPVPFNPHTSYLYTYFPRFRGSVTQLGHLIASMLLSANRLFSLDPLVVARIPRHLTSYDGVDGPETSIQA